MTPIWILAGLLSLAGAGAWYERLARLEDERRHPPRGRRIAVRGCLMHVRLLGERRRPGDPVLILDGGLTANSVSWFKVCETLAARHQVVSFDRAGHLWSASRRGARTAARNNEELRELLRELGVTPPYVYVAHSYSGLLARLFAARYRGEMAGLILIETTPAKLAAFSRRTVLKMLLPLWAALASVGVLRLLMRGKSGNPGWPADLEAWGVLSKSGRTMRAILSELWAFAPNGVAADAVGVALADLPLVALASTRTYGKDLPVPPGMTADQANSLSVGEQRAVAALSRRSVFRVHDDCGHEIPWERPELVVGAVASLEELMA